MKQFEYAELVGSNEKSFSAYLNGRSEFPLEVFMRIAEKEGISPSVLYYTDMALAASLEDVLKEPEDEIGYKRQANPMSQALTTIERLTAMLADCMASKSRIV